MCLALFAWNALPGSRLLLVANRDEFHERPASPAGWWEDHPEIFAGRDLLAGGTWLGISRSPAEIQLMQTLKQALDPQGILNPGRVVDTPES